MEIPLLTESDSFEQLFTRIDFDTNYPSEEIAEVINPSPENIASANIFNLETEQEDSPLTTLISTQDNIIRKIKEDFTTRVTTIKKFIHCIITHYQVNDWSITNNKNINFAIFV